MHVVDDLRGVEHDHEVFGSEADGFLLHGLWNPDAGVLRHSDLSADHTHVHALKFLRLTHGVGVEVGLHPLEVAGDDFRVGVSLTDGGV